LVKLKLLIFTDIKCPDYGDLKIKRVIPYDLLSKYLDIHLNQKKAFKNLISSIIENDLFDFSKLTEKDLDYIAQEISKLHGVELQYLNSRELEIPRAESLSGALKESLKVKNIENLKELMKPLSERLKIKTMGIERLFEPILRNEKMIKEMMGIQSRFQEMKKELMGISGIGTTIVEISKIGEGIEGVLDVGKTLGGIAGTVKAFEVLSIGKILGDHIQKQSLELHKMSLNITPKLFISETLGQAYQSRMTELFQNIGSIGDALKPVSGLLSTTEEALRSFETIGEKISTFAEPLELTNSALIESGKIVSGANNYFLKGKKIKPFLLKRRLPENFDEYEDLLVENNENSEQILQYEAGDSIILTNDIGRALKESITEDIREKIKREFSQFDYFFKRAKILGNPISFLSFLKKGAKQITRNWSHLYWKERGKKYIPSPESHAQGHLGLYISGRFDGIAFVGQELKSGFGYIDLLVNFMGTDYIIEIKMLGAGWSIGWVESGLDQLDNYMEIYNQNESYLFVLDGRITDRGRQLENEYKLNNGKVYVVTSRIC